MEEMVCPWATDSSLELNYHNSQWGIPIHDDQLLFEMLVLETMQAGLSWKTVLTKREGLKKAFDNFSPQIIKEYDQNKIESLLLDKSIIRNRLKIMATISNAEAFLKITDEFGSFDTFIWSYVDNKPIQPNRTSLVEIPNYTPLAEHISKELKKRGFKFVGPTTVYAYMQSIGMINDHLLSCPSHKKCLKLSK